MKLTTKQLRQIIREEVDNLKESWVDDWIRQQELAAEEAYAALPVEWREGPLPGVRICKDLWDQKDHFSREVQIIIDALHLSDYKWKRFRTINRSTGVLNLQKFRKLSPTASDDEIYQAVNFLDEWFEKGCRDSKLGNPSLWDEI